MRRTPVKDTSRNSRKTNPGRRVQKPKSPPLDAPPDSSSHVSLLTREGTYEVPHEVIGGLSTYWDYVYRHRNRWWDSAAALHELGIRALKLLADLGVFREYLTEIGRAGLVEVRIPFTDEERGWAARILPWEFLLRLATRRRDLVVIRHLDVSVPGINRMQNAPGKLLFVQSAPGALADMYNFNIEKWLVKGSLDLDDDELEDPTSEELEAKIDSYRPDIIHLAGIDLHEGDYLLDYEGTNKEWDGYYLAGANFEEQRVGAMRLGRILNPGGVNGALVSCNFYYSAARIAALAVANGATAAIGFQDEVDDALAERFFANFYQRWRAHKWNMLEAFEEVWLKVAAEQGAGLVFWSRYSLVRDRQGRVSKSKVPKPKILKLGANKSEAIRVEVQPNTKINYSLLHNGEGLFRKFRIYKSEPKYANGIQVDVSLNMGTGSFPYAASFDFDGEDSVLDIAEHVNLPLTSELARSLRESVQTSLRIRVRYAGQDLYNETHRVTLQPVNEWEFDQESGARWLGSFILPGDPAVREVVDAAQKYLMALCDDSGRGFDGYQSTEPESDDPDAGVDMQVRALWCALSFDYSVSYINPPPVFTEGSQRLRTPSDVITGRRGTCIDLALLFAACLEYVDIHPVIFVLSDHAFPGYWRNNKAYDEFIKMKKAPERSESVEGASMDINTQLNLAYEEMRQCVRDGLLVPLETVWLTLHRGFSDAVEAGLENLRSSENFEALLNIKKLRGENVTPLPICGETT